MTGLPLRIHEFNVIYFAAVKNLTEFQVLFVTYSLIHLDNDLGIAITILTFIYVSKWYELEYFHKMYLLQMFDLILFVLSELFLMMYCPLKNDENNCENKIRNWLVHFEVT